MRRGGALLEWAAMTILIGGAVALFGKLMLDYVSAIDAAVIKAVGF